MTHTIKRILTLVLLLAATTVTAQDWRWAARSNLLVPGLNAGIGVTTGAKGRFSVGADIYYPWLWPFRDNRWCFELLAGGLEARWTFRDGTDPFRRGTGPSVGVSAMAGYYDFERAYKGLQGEFWSVGIDFRWTFPINRNRWRLGVGVGAGYLYSQSRDYVVYTPGGDLFRTGQWTNYLNFYGPVRADVTLTIPIWHDTKEGAR